jgi:hypothetical protein
MSWLHAEKPVDQAGHPADEKKELFHEEKGQEGRQGRQKG